MSIRDNWVRIKGFLTTIGSEWIVAGIVVLVGFGSFAMGRLSALESVREPIHITQVAAATESISEASGGIVVASRNGSKYHFPWCTGAQQIKESNKIQFDSPEEARKAGYAPAANCKGLY